MLPKSVLIHCQPSLLDFIKENNMDWEYSSVHDHDEIDVVVDDIPYEILRGDFKIPMNSYVNITGLITIKLI